MNGELRSFVSSEPDESSRIHALAALFSGTVFTEQHNTYVYFCKILLNVTTKLFPWPIKRNKKMYEEWSYNSPHSDTLNRRNFTASRFPQVHIWVGDWVNSITPVRNRN